MTRKANRCNKPQMNRRSAKARRSRTQKKAVMTGGMHDRLQRGFNAATRGLRAIGQKAATVYKRAGNQVKAKINQAHREQQRSLIKRRLAPHIQQPNAPKPFGFMNKTKKFFGGIKQRISNKMSGVTKFESLFNGPKQITLDKVSYTINYFKADSDKLIECTGYKTMQSHIANNIKLTDSTTLNSLLNDPQIGNSAQIIQKLRKKQKLGLIYMYNNKQYLGTQEINESTLTSPNRIFMYATYDSNIPVVRPNNIPMPGSNPQKVASNPVQVKVTQNNNKGLGDEKAILFTVKDSTGKDIHFKYRNITQSSKINDIVVDINKSLSDSNRLCSWDDILYVITNSNHEQKINDIIKKISSLQNNKKLSYIYNDNGVIKYTKETDTGISNNQTIIDSTKLPDTVKYVVYAYKASEGIYNTPLGKSSNKPPEYLSIGNQDPTTGHYEEPRVLNPSNGDYMTVENAGLRDRSATITQSAELQGTNTYNRTSSNRSGLRMTNASNSHPLQPGPNK